jgi:N-methylhydantoinase B
MGLRRVYRAEADCRLRVDGSRLRSAPWGLAGGMPGGRAAFDFGAAPFDHGKGPLRQGDIVVIVTAGAGGYGPPSARAPDAVARDLREGRIDQATVREIYGR